MTDTTKAALWETSFRQLHEEIKKERERMRLIASDPTASADKLRCTLEDSAAYLLNVADAYSGE
jgi:hypothetical protein